MSLFYRIGSRIDNPAAILRNVHTEIRADERPHTITAFEVVNGLEALSSVTRARFESGQTHSTASIAGTSRLP